MVDLQKFEKFLSRTMAEIEFLTKKRDSIESESQLLTKTLAYLNEALDVMNAVSILSQDEFKGVVEELVTEALQSVYGNTYSFEIDSKVQRNQPEIYFYVVIDGERYAIRNDELGGGVIDVVSFALRVVLWAMTDPQTDNVIIMDEPLKNLDEERLKLIGGMIKELSRAFNLQFIIVTHQQQLANLADSSFLVAKDRNTSIVKKLDERNYNQDLYCV